MKHERTDIAALPVACLATIFVTLLLSAAASGSRGLPGPIEHGPRDSSRVALTFDACRGRSPSGFDRAAWDVIVEKRVPVTVFMGGAWMEEHPEEARMMAESGLAEIGNHSYTHPDFRKLSREKLDREIGKTQAAQERILGKRGELFRFPFGTYDQQAMEAVSDAGLVAVQWDVVSGDPDPNIGARHMREWVLGRVKPGSIIIFHINGKGVNTAAALPYIVDGLRRSGYELVTVSDLLGLPDEPPSCLAGGTDNEKGASR